MSTQGVLADGEPHPAARDALRYIEHIPFVELMKWYELFSSRALADNRLADVCAETLRRVMQGEPVSDRYVLGLAWTMKDVT